MAILGDPLDVDPAVVEQHIVAIIRMAAPIKTRDWINVSPKAEGYFCHLRYSLQFRIRFRTTARHRARTWVSSGRIAIDDALAVVSATRHEIVRQDYFTPRIH